MAASRATRSNFARHVGPKNLAKSYGAHNILADLESAYTAADCAEGSAGSEKRHYDSS